MREALQASALGALRLHLSKPGRRTGGRQVHSPLSLLPTAVQPPETGGRPS